ncbi:MAG: class I SAM-dependent methyltransferase [Gemmatimonadota bacterium]
MNGSERAPPGASKPGQVGYPYKKRFYRDAGVADRYDEDRFTGPFRSRRDRRKWRAIRAALRQAEGLRTVLDLPCGTGRFTGRLARCGYVVVGSDISWEMMGRATAAPREADVLGYVQAEAERLPFAGGAVDGIVCVRFLFHVDPATRVAILRELGRVGRWLLLDYRHRYSYRYLKWRILRSLAITRRPLERVSRAQLDRECAGAGLRIHSIHPVDRIFSDKWIVLAESRGRETGEASHAGS